MNNFKKVTTNLLIAFAGAVIAIAVYSTTIGKTKVVTVQEPSQPVQLTSLPSAPQGQVPDLTFAAEKSVHAVVHIQTMIKNEAYGNSGNPFFDFFFGDRGGQYQQQQPQYTQASGSGVIISPDGYIVTNNHVVDDADNIQVILNDDEKYDAKVIGRDPNTDIALVKIDAKNLPYLTWGNSDALKLGEWVLAVGNPFNLTSTVTAGIVSAKGRSIGITSGKMPLESFIQTDAAVNPGNSGGALVNIRGELVGINTAIASRTGSYSGYSFAVPSAIAEKVVNDLKEYGEVQRAMLGVTIQRVTSQVAKDKGIDKIEGIYIDSVTNDGAAKHAGIQSGDVILKIDDTVVNTNPELMEQLAKHRPGDQVTLTIKRDGKLKLYKVILRNTRGDTSIIKESFTVLGAKFGPVSQQDIQRLQLNSGIQVDELSKGKLKDLGVKEGFIITEINKMPVSSVDDVKRTLNQTEEGRPILIEGVYPNGEWAYYVFRVE